MSSFLLNKANLNKEIKCKQIQGLEQLDKVIGIDQSPIGALQDLIQQPIQVFFRILETYFLNLKKREQEDINQVDLASMLREEDARHAKVMG